MSTSADFRQKFRDIQASVSGKKVFFAGDVTITYSMLEDRLSRTTALFRKIGLAPGDRVMVASAHEAEVVVLYLAMLQAGLTAVVIDPHSTAEEMENLIRWADPKVMFVDYERVRSASFQIPSGLEIIQVRPAAAVRRTGFGLLLGKDKRPAADIDSYPANTEKLTPNFELGGAVRDEETAIILFTSGTTSRPKGVELSRRNLFAQFETFERHYGFDKSRRILNHLPLHHTDGLNQGAAITSFTGATWLRPNPQKVQNVTEIMDLVFREHATHLITVPTMMALMLRFDSEFDDTFSSPEFCYVASTAGYLEEKLWREFESRFQVRVVNSYGLTETVSEAIYCGPTEETRKLGTIGRPVDCEARILGPEGVEVGRGEIGEIAIRGENVMKGYFRNPEATAEVFRDDWFLTGDLGVEDEDGYFSVVGRKKNVIIRGGLNVYPEDVTDSVLKMPGILDAVTFGMSDELLGERVVTCVTLDGAVPVSTNQVFAFVRERLAPEKTPSDIFILPSLPRGPAGKVLLREVKAIAEEIRQATTVDVTGGVEEKVYAVAASVFKLDASSLNPASEMKNTDGWDSLSHLEFVLQLERITGGRFSPRDVLRISTLGDAIKLLSEKEPKMEQA